MKPDIKEVAEAFKAVLEALKLDMKDDNLKETHTRLAKMYVEELFCGLYTQPPEIKTFSNKGSTWLYTKVPFKSTCAHHFQPVSGICHIMIDYETTSNVIGLSKFNRIVKHFANRPTLQERLTTDVLEHLTKEVGGFIQVCIQAKHHCVTDRGVCASMSDTFTLESNTDNQSFIDKCSAYYRSEEI